VAARAKSELLVNAEHLAYLSKEQEFEAFLTAIKNPEPERWFRSD